MLSSQVLKCESHLIDVDTALTQTPVTALRWPHDKWLSGDEFEYCCRACTFARTHAHDWILKSLRPPCMKLIKAYQRNLSGLYLARLHQPLASNGEPGVTFCISLVVVWARANRKERHGLVEIDVWVDEAHLVTRFLLFCFVARATP